MTSIHYAESVWVELYIDMILWYTLARRWSRKLSLGEVDDLWGSADERFDVFPFDLFGFPEPALKVLYLSLHVAREPEQIRNHRRMTRGTDFYPYPKPRHLVPLNRVLALSNDRRFLCNRAPLRPPFAFYRIIHRE